MSNESKTVTWSPEQNAFYGEAGGHSNLFVEACAGTGKTTSVKEFLLRAPEAKKAYVVFNKKNRLEAQAKITSGVEIRTLNGLGFRFCSYTMGGKVEPTDEVEFDRIKAVEPRIDSFPTAVSDIKNIVSYAKGTKPFATVADLCAIAVNKGWEPDADAESKGWTTKRYAEVARKAMQHAIDVRDPQNRISFDDQCWLPIVKGWVRPWFDLVCVDEFQDTNVTQRMLVRKACKKSGRVVVVGDPRQAIYAFRGADVAGYETSKVEMGAKVLPLTVTYRCAQAIVREAQRLVPHYQAAPSAPEGVVRASTEAAMLAEVKPGDAIISRKNAPLMGVCLALLKAGVPARIEGRDITKQLHAIVKKCRAATIELFIENVLAWAAKKSDKASKAKDSERLIQEITDSAEVITTLAADCDAVSEVDSRLDALFGNSTDENGVPNPVPAVVLSSVHKAKGLEWNRVYLLEGTFDPKWSTEASEDLNIKYVAITRAISELVWITDAKFRPAKRRAE